MIRPVKGVIFNLLEQVVTDKYGAGTWEGLLSDTGLEGVYTAVGSYPDEDLTALIGAAGRRLETSEQDLTRWFGRSALPLLAERYPRFFEGHSSVATFLASLNDVIHAEVRKLYPEAIVPSFDFIEATPDRVVMAYRSPRQMCALAEGFIEAAADHFSEYASIEQSECILRGDGRCLIAVDIQRGG